MNYRSVFKPLILTKEQNKEQTQSKQRENKEGNKEQTQSKQRENKENH